MSHCVACNRVLDYGTLYMTNPDTGEPEDMCATCRQKAYEEYSVLYDHTYEHHDITEGVSGESKKGYYYDFHEF